MAWPIPDIPEKQSLPRLKLWLWMVVLLFMLSAGVLSSLWMLKATDYINVLLYGVLPAFLIWLCVFGTVFNRYEQSTAAKLSWDAEKEQTKTEWQHWSRRQLAVVGNVLFSPEEKGMEALLGDFKDVPAYPKKARSLFDSLHNYSSLMSKIDLQLEQQYPHYRYLLNSIYVLQASGRFDKKSNEAIFQQWDLVPETFNSIEPLQSLYDSNDKYGLILIICLQDWSLFSPKQASEIISAQLIVSPDYAHQQAMPVIAGLNRIMPLEPGGFTSDLNMFFEYSGADKDSLEYIWISGNTEKTTTDIMQYANGNQWSLPENRFLHSIDFSFGPPGEMALPLSLAMMVEAANKTDRDQLLIYQTPQQTGALCLITWELYI